MIISRLDGLIGVGLHDFDTIRVRFLVGELDAFGGEFDLSFFVKFSGCHFECLFAHAEEGIDRFGIGLVVVGEAAFVFLQEPENFVGGVFYAGIAGTAGGHVDLVFAGGGLVGGEDILDKAGELVADFDIAIDLVEKWRTPVWRLLMMTT